MVGYIYKIVNDINGKMYIGLCTTTIEQRFQTHCADCFKPSCEKRPLYQAMKKYGIENFHYELIEECDIDFLGEREQYWIAYYDTYKNGYNATLGGDGKPIHNHSDILKRLKECPYTTLVAEEFGCCVDIVRGIAKRNNIALQSLKHTKTICAFNKQTHDFVQQFNSTSEAAEWCFQNQYSSSLNSGVRSHIVDCANGKRKSAYGFVWKYKE